ncbi:unnamed protein product [[Candida] boidinii]|nr:unnamed protein product [[Candida] boidinii]GMF64363.1 unnamed protein product [[Candida] boidinii]
MAEAEVVSFSSAGSAAAAAGVGAEIGALAGGAGFSASSSFASSSSSPHSSSLSSSSGSSLNLLNDCEAGGTERVGGGGNADEAFLGIISDSSSSSLALVVKLVNLEVILETLAETEDPFESTSLSLEEELIGFSELATSVYLPCFSAHS